MRRNLSIILIAGIALMPQALVYGDPASSHDADGAMQSGDAAVGRTERPIPRRGGATDGARPTQGEENAAVTLPDTGLISLFWPLLIVLGLVVGATAAVRKWMPNAARGGGGGAIKVLARQYISSKQSLCLVRLGGRVVLIGVTPQSMATLSEITDADEMAGIAAALQRGAPGSFSAAMSKVAAVDSDGDDSVDQDAVATAPTGAGGRLDVTESRVSELVARIRAISSEH